MCALLDDSCLCRAVPSFNKVWRFPRSVRDARHASSTSDIDHIIIGSEFMFNTTPLTSHRLIVGCAHRHSIQIFYPRHLRDSHIFSTSKLLLSDKCFSEVEYVDTVIISAIQSNMGLRDHLSDTI